jgi:hypothetical protein
VTGPGGQPFVIRVPVTVADPAAAVRLARVVGRMLRLLPQVNPYAISVATETGTPYRVFCARLLANGRRCLLRAGHDGRCARRVIP